MTASTRPSSRSGWLRPTTWIIAVVAAVPGVAVAQAAAVHELTVEDAVRLAVDREAVTTALDARVEASRAEERSAGAWPNPEVGFEHEQLIGGETEDTVVLSQTIDFAGKRGADADAAELRTREVAAGNDVVLLERERRARLGFYRTLHAQRVRAALEDWLSGIEEAARVASERAAAGEASEYDRLRLSRELARGRGRLQQVVAAEERAWSELEGLLGAGALDARPRLVGELGPDGRLPAAPELEERLARSPDRVALEAAVETRRMERRAAGRAWFPGVDLTLGYKTAEAEGDRDHGFVAGISLPLPLFDRAEGARGAAEARRRLAEADLRLARDLQLSEARGLKREAALLAAAATALRDQVGSGASRLIETAHAAYRGGEIGVLELVDAHENELVTAVELCDLELAAREAMIDLDRRLGRSGR